MLEPSFAASPLREASPGQARAFLSRFFPKDASFDEKVKAVESALGSPMGQLLRAELGRWIVEQAIPVNALVPEEYQNWRPPVRDALVFVVSHLSDARLAPKLVEQLELPPRTPPELRLLRLIVKVPGLQKLGQVIARNRYLSPALRRALSRLENDIRDVAPAEIRAIVERELGERLRRFDVRIAATLLSEGSVSAVMRFTWRRPLEKHRQRGVFKVLKPYIPTCFPEDMEMLQGLAEFFGSRHRQYGIARDVLTDTFTKVRRLLQHEVHFVGEQKTLVEAAALYRTARGVRVPRVIEPLCTPTITAMSEERGVKVTDAATSLSARQRERLAAGLVESLLAIPLFAAEQGALFHADPHAGNLFYDAHSGEIILLDWALTERLSREQRRHMALLVFLVGLRDRVAAAGEIRALSDGVGETSPEARRIRRSVNEFIDSLPLTHMPSVVDAMRLLQRIAALGIRFSAPIIMLSKVLFTLDGVVADIRGSGVSMSYTLARHAVHSWLTKGAGARLPITGQDLARLPISALFYGGRLSIRLEEALLERLLEHGGGDGMNTARTAPGSARSKPAAAREHSAPLARRPAPAARR